MMQNLQTGYPNAEKRTSWKKPTKFQCLICFLHVQWIWLNQLVICMTWSERKYEKKNKWGICSLIYLKLSNINLNDQVLTLSAHFKWLSTIIFFMCLYNNIKVFFPTSKLLAQDNGKNGNSITPVAIGGSLGILFVVIVAGVVIVCRK